MAWYMVHKHEATKAGLHWDLRLEYKGVLKSWAIPKGMPRKSGVRHLAIQTPDHDLDYGKWEGTIPEGSYGAGKVTIDATGEYRTIDKTNKKWKFECLTGKYKGTWNLIHWKNKQWLITKSA
jgi:DNA ligase D-like protein (predicted 3'-phosphoesterase)